MKLQRSHGPVLVACPDSRPPAYQAVVGLHRTGKLRGFVTASYYDPTGCFASFSRRLAPVHFPGWSECCFAVTTRKSLRPSSRPSHPSICCSGSKPASGKGFPVSAVRWPGAGPSGSTPNWQA